MSTHTSNPHEPNQNEENHTNETDVQRLVRQHLQDKNHVITEEEIASIRVGMGATPDASTREAAEELQERADRRDDTGNTATPWDVIEPK